MLQKIQCFDIGFFQKVQKSQRSERNDMTETCFVETKDLTKAYTTGRIQFFALNGVTLSVKKGRFLAVTGASGSGKSTLMNLLGGLDRPTSGTITVDDKCISKLDKKGLTLYRRHHAGMIFQSFNLISSYTALENVAFPLLFSGVPKKERNRRAAEMLEKVGLSSRSNHLPSELSGGEQQRVAVARALINQPKLLLADEPTGNLDSKNAKQIVRTLADLNTEHGLTIIMISHEENLLREFANDLVRLEDGKVIENQTIR
jgi:putative ABC transport system ATP-binding protein